MAIRKKSTKIDGKRFVVSHVTTQERENLDSMFWTERRNEWFEYIIQDYIIIVWRGKVSNMQFIEIESFQEHLLNMFLLPIC